MIDIGTDFAHLQAVGLAQLESAAALRTRVDRKYLLGHELLGEVVRSLDPSIRVLEVDGSRSLRYSTVYFDTPDLTSYRDAARSRPRRFKVRTRSYLDSDIAFLEVKERDRTGLTIKHRLPYEPEHSHTLTARGRSFLSTHDSVEPVVDSLTPTLTVTYRRTTLLEPETMSRITVDVAVEATTRAGGRVTSGPSVIVETKTTVPPTTADRALWSLRQRPTSFSKYCTLLAATDSRLPANKWHRTLTRHFDTRPHLVPV